MGRAKIPTARPRKCLKPGLVLREIKSKYENSCYVAMKDNKQKGCEHLKAMQKAALLKPILHDPRWILTLGNNSFPKVYAWVDRFDRATRVAEDSAPKLATLKGAEAVKEIAQAEFPESDGNIDAEDPMKLKKGQYVESSPVNSGFRHRDSGQLVNLIQQEVVLKTQAKIGHRDIHVHHPRTNFRIQAVGGDVIRGPLGGEPTEIRWMLTHGYRHHL
ncbi:MAG: hypothetical protein Q9181_002942 [Wetmoreana brouardii]